MINKYKKKLLILCILFFVILTFLYFQNNSIETSHLSIESQEIPKSFNGYTILQVSDLHSKSFGSNQKVLVQKIKKLEPDIIVVTGDLVDQKNYNEDISMNLIEQLVDIVPVYYVTGNHEWWSDRFDSLEENLIQAGVTVMRNSSKSIEVEGERITLIGIDDPAQAIGSDGEYALAELSLKDALSTTETGSGFRILLSHRPELFSLYSQNDIDLIFAGHAHGGQVRLPFIGGLIAPNQGFLPEYTAGKYVENGSTMVVSRGLGNSIIPQRVFNRPELVLVTLKTSN